MAVSLLEVGLASVHDGSAERSKFAELYYKTEQAAKEAKKGVK